MKQTMSFRKFKAELNTDSCDPYTNAELTLTLRLGFRQVNPAGGAPDGTYHDYGDAAEPTRRIVQWSSGAWNLWKKNFVDTATRFWDGKFWLANNFQLYEFEKNGIKYYPNIWCRLKIVDRPIALGNHHHVIDVVRLHGMENWFGSHSTLYDNRDTKLIQKGTDTKGHAIMQRAHVHEVGHLLGLQHVDVGKTHCPPGPGTNASACYGIKDVDKYSVMGQGMALRRVQAMPWRKAMVAMSGKGRVLTPGDWQAKLQRIYPRLPAEAAANAMLTHRPLRA